MSSSLAPHVTLAETEHGMVLLDERSGRYWQANRTAAAVLRALRDGHSTDRIVADLCDRFPDQAERITLDVQRILDTFHAAEVLRS